MKQKPIKQPMPHKPKRIVTPMPEGLSPEDRELFQRMEEDAPETYRQGNFLILYSRDEQSCMVADLNGKTVLRHFGPVEEVFALLTPLQSAKSANQRIYPETFANLSDEEFDDQGMTALDEMMSDGDMIEPDVSQMRSMVENLRGSLLDELIKLPEKKP